MSALDLDSASDKEAAYNGYKAAKDSYMEQYETAKEKRLEAKSYIEDAEKFISDVASYAVKADSILPLTEKIPGIEDEDAKMLEDYEFADPKDFIIDLNAPREEKTPNRPTVSADSGEESKSSGKVDELPADESDNKSLPASSEETNGPLEDNSREGRKSIENADASTVDAK